MTIIPGVGSVALTTNASFSPAGNYTLWQPADTTANITPKTLSVTSISVADKPYDGTCATSITETPALIDVVAGDHVGLDRSKKRADALNQALQNFDDTNRQARELTQMMTVMLTRQFSESTFGNWLRQNGPIIAAAVAATIITIASCGTASWVWIGVGILLAPAVALAASELMTEGTYWLPESWGIGPGTQSRLGAYLNNVPEWDAQAGELRPRELWRDVGLPYGRQYLFDLVFSAASMGIGAAAGAGMSRLVNTVAARFLCTNNELLRRLGAQSARMAQQANQNQAVQPFLTRLRETFGHLPS